MGGLMDKQMKRKPQDPIFLSSCCPVIVLCQYLFTHSLDLHTCHFLVYCNLPCIPYQVTKMVLAKVTMDLNSRCFLVLILLDYLVLSWKLPLTLASGTLLWLPFSLCLTGFSSSAWHFNPRYSILGSSPLNSRYSSLSLLHSLPVCWWFPSIYGQPWRLFWAPDQSCLWCVSPGLSHRLLKLNISKTKTKLIFPHPSLLPFQYITVLCITNSALICSGKCISI